MRRAAVVGLQAVSAKTLYTPCRGHRRIRYYERSEFLVYDGAKKKMRGSFPPSRTRFSMPHVPPDHLSPRQKKCRSPKNDVFKPILRRSRTKYILSVNHCETHTR